MRGKEEAHGKRCCRLEVRDYLGRYMRLADTAASRVPENFGLVDDVVRLLPRSVFIAIKEPLARIWNLLSQDDIKFNLARNSAKPVIYVFPLLAYSRSAK